MSVVALPGDDGSHHGVGALGLDAARRQHQPGRDDELQSLRPGRRRRLAAPHGRRHRARRARVRPGALAPRPGPGIDHAETSLDSTAGPIAVAWRVADGALSLTVDLPTVGILRLPGTDDLELAPGHHDLSRPWDAQRHSVL
ncbi:alpha-L-rhamnosidase C-terminal domain-containing protein [Microbacterium jiangjiandongii]|uniref:alpha-L-rhamnosidase C-terminal domain-containing protein n=1 Tax=Microbacterium jiangjiandongii TaxID=3049071 RepID=UPI0035B5B495